MLIEHRGQSKHCLNLVGKAVKFVGKSKTRHISLLRRCAFILTWHLNGAMAVLWTKAHTLTMACPNSDEYLAAALESSLGFTIQVYSDRWGARNRSHVCSSRYIWYNGVFLPLLHSQIACRSQYFLFIFSFVFCLPMMGTVMSLWR